MVFEHNGIRYRIEQRYSRDMGVVCVDETNKLVAGWSYDAKRGAHVCSKDGRQQERDKDLVVACKRLLG